MPPPPPPPPRLHLNAAAARHHLVVPSAHTWTQRSDFLTPCGIMFNYWVVFEIIFISSWHFLPLLSAVVSTGEIWEFLSFTERHPSVIYNILLFGVTSALGQVGGSFTLIKTLECIRQITFFNVCVFFFYTSFPDLHLHDGGVFWASDLLHRHHHQEVLHHPWLCSSVRQRHECDAVVGHRPRVPRWDWIPLDRPLDSRSISPVRLTNAAFGCNNHDRR